MSQIDCLQFKLNYDLKVEYCILPQCEIMSLLYSNKNTWILVTKSCGMYTISNDFHTIVKYIHGNEDDITRQFKEKYGKNQNQ